MPLLDPATGQQVIDEEGNPVYVDGSDMPHTFVTYAIEQIYKGFPPRTNPTQLMLRFEGGQSDKVSPLGRAYLLGESYPLFDLGDRDILFVKGNAQSPCPLTDCHSGRFRVLTDPNDPIPNLIFSELGMEIRYIIPAAGGRVAAWQIVFGPQRLLPQITTHTMGEIELETVHIDPAAGTVPPPVQNLQGIHVDYDYGEGVHIHSMCRQVNGCWSWTGHDFVYEKGRTDGSNYPKPKQSPIPADISQGPSSHHQEQIDTLYYVNKGEPLNQARAVAQSTAAAIMGRISAYTGQQVSWKEIMEDPGVSPKHYNLTLRPTAEDFEKGTVEIPKENVVPSPGWM